MHRLALRTASAEDVPEHEQVEERPHNCALDGPPHAFEAGWALASDASNHDDTVPALWCAACGDIRAFTIPSDD